MLRVLRSRTGLLVVALVALVWLGAAAVLAGSTRLGVALALAVLSLLAGWAMLAATRLEWLQRTQHRAVVERLRELPAAGTGSVQTPMTTLGTGAVGRAAAGSPVGRPREELLAELPGLGRRPSRPVVAGVVTPALADRIAEVADVVVLTPWAVVRTLDEAAATMLVVEERALREGVWFGAETTSALSLSAELDAALSWCGDRGASVVGVLAPGVGGVVTPLLRARYGVALPASDDLQPHGIPADPLLILLQEYAVAQHGSPAEATK